MRPIMVDDQISVLRLMLVRSTYLTARCCLRHLVFHHIIAPLALSLVVNQVA